VGASSPTGRTGRSSGAQRNCPVLATKTPCSPPAPSFLQNITIPFSYVAVSTVYRSTALVLLVPSVAMVISSTQQQLPVRVMGCTGLVTGLQPHTVCSVLPEQRYCAVRPVLLLAQQQLVSEGAECSRSWSVQQPCRLLQYWLSSYRLGLLFPGQQ
jgi:hypothetical protein